MRLWRAEQIDAEVEAHAESTCGSEEFPRMVHEAEDWIEDHAPRQIRTNLHLPCRFSGENGYPACTQCSKAIVPVAVKSEK